MRVNCENKINAYFGQGTHKSPGKTDAGHNDHSTMGIQPMPDVHTCHANCLMLSPFYFSKINFWFPLIKRNQRVRKRKKIGKWKIISQSGKKFSLVLYIHEYLYKDKYVYVYSNTYKYMSVNACVILNEMLLSHNL